MLRFAVEAVGGDRKEDTMPRLIMATLILLSLCQAAGGMEIKEVFSSTSVPEYNRWLRDHVDEYAELPPIHITVDGPAWRESRTRSYPASRACFYDQAGNRIRELRLEEDGTSVSLSAARDRLFVYRRNQLEGTDGITSSLTVYDSRGSVAFQINPACVVTTSHGLVFRGVWQGYEPVKDTLEVFDARGDIVCKIGGPRAPYLSDDNYVYSPDTTHVLILGEDGRRLVVIDRSGNVLWDEILPHRGKLLGISDSGRWVATRMGGRVMLLDVNSSQTCTLSSSHASEIQGRASLVALSDDNRTVAVYHEGQPGSLEFFDFKDTSKSTFLSIDLSGGIRDMKFVGERLLMVSGSDEVAIAGTDGTVRIQAGVADPELRLHFYDDGLALTGDSRMTVYRLEDQ